MDYRLLVDLEAITILEGLPKRVRTNLMRHFFNLRANPDRYVDYHEYERGGRRVDISVFAGYSIHYWIDFADRHVKVLTLKSADRK
jgi:hypothetical protein